MPKPKGTIYVITKKPRGAKVAQPVCYQDSVTDAELFIKLLREEPGNKNSTFGIRRLNKGRIHVEL